jgi:hypothetical protein
MAYCSRGCLPAALILACLPWVARADIASSTVTVEFQDKQTRVTPAEPTINLAASPSVIIEIQPGDNTFNVTPILARERVVSAAEEAKRQVQELAPELTDVLAGLDAVIRDPSQKTVESTSETLTERSLKATPGKMDILQKAKKDISAAAAGTTVSANRVLLNFHRGWWWEYKIRQTKKEERRDRADKLGDAGWDIWLTSRQYAFDFPIEIECVKGVKTCPAGSAKRILIIHVDTASWALAASAGVMFPSLRDERYRVDASSQLKRVHPDGDVPYFVASYLHYCPVNGVPVLDAFCPTLSVGTNVPSSGVVFGLGFGARLKPLASVNSAYLDFGAAYGPRKTLSDTYLDQAQPITVPANTSASAVLTTHYAFRLFFGISLGITADVDKFRGLYSGGVKGKSSETKAAP